MIPVKKRHAVYTTALLCCSLFIVVMKAEMESQLRDLHQEAMEQIDEKKQELKDVDPDDTSYHNDEHDDFGLMPEDEFTDKKNRGQTFDDDNEETQELTNSTEERTINDIIINGNKLIASEAVLNYVPYKIGEPFDPRKTSTLIRNLYSSLKRFKNIEIFGELLGNDKINLHIMVEEKPVVADIVFNGNKNMLEKDFRSKIDFEIPALDEAELKRYVRKLQKLYREKNYHDVEINARSEEIAEGKARVIFDITEHKKTLVSRINFTGNYHLSGKELRKILYTREDWILSFLDNAGSVQPERLDADKHMIEQYYQNNGYLNAKVIDAEIVKDDCGSFIVTFHIEEGDCYTISEVSIDSEGMLNEERVLTYLPVQAGQRYSREAIAESIKMLEILWGDLGYIYAHIDPSIQPDEDNCTVKISFSADKGSQVTLNKITIIGNKKTRDRIIRRRLILEEGSLLTQTAMEESKNRVESLGYFDVRDGVNWKIRRIDAEHADLDLIVKEIKTGHANVKFGFGGSVTSLQNPAEGASLGVEVSDTNLFGSGLQFSFNANLAKDEQSIYFNLTDPWLFDKPIVGAFDLYHRRPSYDELRNTDPVNEILTGGSLTVGFVTRWLNETQILGKIGIDDLHYERRPISQITGRVDNINLEYQHILDLEFRPADFLWLSAILSQDKRNNPMYPSRGIRWNLSARTGLPTLDGDVGFAKVEFDFHWYTPLIGENDLILHFRTFLGVIARFNHRLIPYRELFHIGGPASVRGFIFGQVSPLFLRDSIGGKKAFFVNLDLFVPVTPDFSTVAVLFYDGGTSWDNPYAEFISPAYLRNNRFNYRHAVGFGVRMLKPAPIRIDWGFKLDRKKKLGETPSEVHFSMSYDW